MIRHSFDARQCSHAHTSGSVHTPALRAVSTRPHSEAVSTRPHIPQGKGIPIGRFATQSLHSGSDTSSVKRVGVCVAHDDEKSLRSVTRSQLAPVCGGANARDPHTKDSGLAVTGAERRFPQGRAGQRRADSRQRSVSPVTQKETSTQVSTRTCPTHNTTRRVSRERASTVHSTSARDTRLCTCVGAGVSLLCLPPPPRQPSLVSTVRVGRAA